MTEAIRTAGIRDPQIAVTELARPDSILVTERDATCQQDPVEQDGGVGTHPQLHSRRHRRSMSGLAQALTADQRRAFSNAYSFNALRLALQGLWQATSPAFVCILDGVLIQCWSMKWWRSTEESRKTWNLLLRGFTSE